MYGRRLNSLSLFHLEKKGVEGTQIRNMLQIIYVDQMISSRNPRVFKSKKPKNNSKTHSDILMISRSLYIFDRNLRAFPPNATPPSLLIKGIMLLPALCNAQLHSSLETSAQKLRVDSSPCRRQRRQAAKQEFFGGLQRKIFQVSNAKKLGWLRCIGDYTTQLYRVYNKPL